MRTHALAMGIRGLGISLVMVGAALLTSCGGGGGGSSAPAGVDATGYYGTGTMDLIDTTTKTSIFNPAPTDLQTIISGNRMMGFSPSTGYSVDVQLSVTQSNFTGTATVYFNGVMQANNISVTKGVITKGTSVTGEIAQFTTSAGTYTGTFTLNFTDQSGQTTSLAAIDTANGLNLFNGTQPGATTSGMAQLDFSPQKNVTDAYRISSPSLYVGGAFDLCSLDPPSSLIKTRSMTVVTGTNLYSINFASMGGCTATFPNPAGNNYTGFATHIPNASPNETMVVMLANGAYHFYGNYTR